MPRDSDGCRAEILLEILPLQTMEISVQVDREMLGVVYSAVQSDTLQSNTVHSQSPNNALLKYNGGIYPPRQCVFPSES